MLTHDCCNLLLIRKLTKEADSEQRKRVSADSFLHPVSVREFRNNLARIVHIRTAGTTADRLGHQIIPLWAE